MSLIVLHKPMKRQTPDLPVRSARVSTRRQLVCAGLAWPLAALATQLEALDHRWHERGGAG